MTTADAVFSLFRGACLLATGFCLGVIWGYDLFTTIAHPPERVPETCPEVGYALHGHWFRGMYLTHRDATCDRVCTEETP